MNTMTLINMNLRLIILLGIMLVIEFGFASQALATQYRYTALNAPNATQGTLAYGINNLGQVVGVYHDELGTHGFLYDAGQYTSFDAPQAIYGTYAYAINDHAQIVGNYFNNSGKHGFMLTDGIYTTLDNANGNDTQITGINNQGQMVGNYRLGTTGVYGFLYDSQQNTFTTINNPKASAGNTSAMGINDQSELVGFYYNSGAHGFSYNGTEFTTLNAPQASPAGSFGYGINNLGHIVGVYYDTKGGNGFVYRNGQYEMLSAANIKTLFANAINDHGQIVGYYTDNTGSHGFLADPEAESTALVQLDFADLRATYQAGDRINITVQEPRGIRQEVVDLWVAILTPHQELLYVSPENTNMLSTIAKPFKRKINADVNQHPVIDIQVPPNSSGQYSIFAVFSRPDSSVENLSVMRRSNMAKADVDL